MIDYPDPEGPKARRKAWLLSPEAGWGGDGETVPCWECGVLCGPDDCDLVADRIIPHERGGTYERGNIAPHCATCSHRQGQRATTRICNNRRSAAIVHSMAPMIVATARRLAEAR